MIDEGTSMWWCSRWVNKFVVLFLNGIGFYKWHQVLQMATFLLATDLFSLPGMPNACTQRFWSTVRNNKWAWESPSLYFATMCLAYRSSNSCNTCNVLASAIYWYIVPHVLQVYSVLQYCNISICCYSSNMQWRFSTYSQQSGNAIVALQQLPTKEITRIAYVCLPEYPHSLGLVRRAEEKEPAIPASTCTKTNFSIVE